MKALNAEAADWLLRMQAPDFSAEDRRNLDAWLAGDERRAAALAQVQAILQLAPRAFAALEAPPAISAKIPRQRAWLPLGAAVAASLALFLLFDGPMRLRADLRAGTEALPVVTLADGSLLQLNAGSAVAFSFGEKQRVVHLLRGEAYFTVTKDPARPFIVEAAGGAATALGTEFDVRLSEPAEGAGRAAEVKVLVHAVRVETASGAKVILQAGESLRYDNTGAIGETRRIDINGPDWRSGKIVIEDESLTSVVERLQRHTNTRIVILGDDLKARRIGGTFDTRDPVAAIELLCRSLGIEYSGIGSLLVVLHG
ncbi:FecR family protein [Dongia rigui]|uniref:FecR domain-containing protein n=1 Tax=Dongia rigui TaxID=940149 RepID=A0ABU5E3E5_9PROT|nr:FecR domain-containing protein [Dongia rigui]MDY0873709.1 FecR domain-containing protein [Dongia rigui]